ncbi:hypothetical protein AZI85_14010 [Bdellovibrio bacteriovorus]|uniref:DUF1588 domain-containing protein n=1 Tax=Bdellovibrio bacteriovorus TaxID=959 RepID=A0A150WV46_BDEBC|nr:hypothetical protein AZI85_14010 [Bdellovibrio bacteriovorus]
MTVTHFITVTVMILLASVSSSAQTMSEAALFNRCYTQLTGKPVPLKHATMIQIKAGKVKALDACNSLLDKAELDASGPLINRNDKEARAVLNNFYNFHRTWFPTNAVEQIQEYNEELARGTMDIYDSTEPGLALTRAMFARGAEYKDVLTLGWGVHAQREENAAVRSQIGWNVNFPARRLYGNHAGFNENLFNFRALTGGFNGNSDTTNSMFLHLPKIEVGELVGIRIKSESVMIPNVSLQPLGADRRGNEQEGLNHSFNLNATLGGGVLGTPIYILLNYGHGRGLEANGTTKVPRRWSQTNMNSFLCQELPALRESDIRTMVVGNSSAPFRNSASCVMCHATLDPMAYTTRNVVMAGSDYFVMSEGSRTHSKTALHMVTYKPDLPSVGGWPSEPVANFHRQQPTGRLFFRSMTGTLIDKPVNGVAQLGEAMANTPDYYNCAAKRYFEYFTGIQVALYDRSNPANAELNRKLSSESIADREFVEALGAELRDSQSVRRMIKRIMSSKYYKEANFREQ